MSDNKQQISDLFGLKDNDDKSKSLSRVVKNISNYEASPYAPLEPTINESANYRSDNSQKKFNFKFPYVGSIDIKKDNNEIQFNETVALLGGENDFRSFNPNQNELTITSLNSYIYSFPPNSPNSYFNVDNNDVYLTQNSSILKDIKKQTSFDTASADKASLDHNDELNNSYNYARNINRTRSIRKTFRKSKRIIDENQRIVINVGGMRYETRRKTLTLVEASRLANLNETNCDYDAVKNEYFFDRDPTAFLAILNFCRTGKLHAPADICLSQFSDELKFWGVKETSLEPCCLTAFTSQKHADETFKKIMENKEETSDGNYDESDNTVGVKRRKFLTIPKTISNRCNFTFLKRIYQKNRPKLWRFLDDRKSSLPAAIFFWLSVIILFVSLINFVLSTSAYFRVPFDIANDFNLSRATREELTEPHGVLRSIEIFCNVFFTVELIFRFLSSPNKLKFLRLPYNILEFLAILPIFFPTKPANAASTWSTRAHNYLEVCYILRILRIFVLVPKYSGLRVLLLTVQTSLGELFLYMMLLLMTLMIFASFIFYAEQIYEAEKNPFESILISLWWAVVTMTTLGYGDIVPSTPYGRLIGAMCALCGLVFLALPIPVVVNNFATYYSQAKGYQKLESYLAAKEGLRNRAAALNFPVASDVENGSNFNDVDKRNHIIEEVQSEGTTSVKDGENNTEIGLTPYDKKSLTHVSNSDKIQEIPQSNQIHRRKGSITDAKIQSEWESCIRAHERRNALVLNSLGLVLGSSNNNLSS